MCGTGAAAKGTLECAQDCNAQGTCRQGVCHCQLGYVGSACEQRICWDSAQCGGADECHSSGECLRRGETASAGFPSAPPPPVPPPPAPPPGFYAYGDWSVCPETCTDGTSVRTRDFTCGGDCSALGDPLISSPCPPQPCVDSACDTNPCGGDNLCSVQEVDGGAAVTCRCVDGATGGFCQADETGCHLDGDGVCCPEPQGVAITGECCRPGMRVARDGYCCWESDLDPCNICGGQTALVDSYGTCCPVATVDADGACCMEAIDLCGAFCLTTHRYIIDHRSMQLLAVPCGRSQPCRCVRWRWDNMPGSVYARLRRRPDHGHARRSDGICDSAERAEGRDCVSPE